MKRRRQTVQVDAGAAGERLDLFLARALAVSRAAVKRAIDGGRIFIDGRAVRRAGHPLAGGETIDLTFAAAPPAPPAAEPAVLYRDASLLALAKPAGLPSHPTVAGGANALGWATELLRRQGAATTPILLHRLDADTSGVLLFALTPGANRALAAAFAERRVEKIYLALVAGAPPAVFQVSNHLRPGRRGRVEAVRAGGQPALTDFRTLATGSGFSLVEARPKTGRTHQIRVHLAGEGYPLVGDRLYGGPTAVAADGRTLVAGRHLLHAFRLFFSHPESGGRTLLEAPMPDDFTPFLQHLKLTDSTIFSVD